MYKTILVPIDLSNSETGKGAIELARNLCDSGGRIILVNVIEEVPTYVAVELPGGFQEKARENAREELAGMANAAGIHAEIAVRSGSAHTAILAAAEETGAELIIVSSHRPGFSDYLLGSTAARVVRHSKCSVLVTR